MQANTAIAIAIAPVVLAILKWAYEPLGRALRRFLGTRLPDGRLKRVLLKRVD